jgi:hypothetical protein
MSAAHRLTLLHRALSMLVFLRIDMVLIILQTIAGFLFGFVLINYVSLAISAFTKKCLTDIIASQIFIGYAFAVLTYTLVTR